MAARNQLDLVITSLVLIRKASSAIEAALNLPASDRAQIEGQIEAVRSDLSQLLNLIGGSIPGAGGLAKRPEVKAVAGVVEFLARQGSSQLGAVAGVADALKSGDDSRGLAQRIEARLRADGIATREELAAGLKIDADSPQLQEALERLLGSGRAEWYGPGVYGMPRGQLEVMGTVDPGGAEDTDEEDAAEDESDDQPKLAVAVSALEGSLSVLAGTLSEGTPEEIPAEERIRELRHLADSGVISDEEFEARRRELLDDAS